jgi:hypothetical protein
MMSNQHHRLLLETPFRNIGGFFTLNHTEVVYRPVKLLN